MAEIDIDLSGLKKYTDKLDKLSIDRASKNTVREVSNRALALTKKETPVWEPNEYYIGPPRVGGTLRRSWHLTKPEPIWGGYKVEMFNDARAENGAFYATYVEYGHPQTPGRFVPVIGRRLVASWVYGEFMMTRALKQVGKEKSSIAKKYFEAEVRRMKDD